MFSHVDSFEKTDEANLFIKKNLFIVTSNPKLKSISKKIENDNQKL